MPEGPSVKKFQILCAPFVGQTVTKVGGSTRQVNPDDLKMLTLWDAQVHGKNLFLAFGTAQEIAAGCASMTQESSEHGGTGPGTSVSLPRQDGDEADPGGLVHWPRKEHGGGLASLPEDAAECPRAWLRFHFGLYGSIRAGEFARANKANKKGDWRDPIPRWELWGVWLVLHFDGGSFLVFYNCRIQPCSSPAADPSADILSPEFDRERAMEVLRKAVPVCYTLLDQRYFSGLGNRIKNEALYLARVHPLSLGSLLEPSELRSVLDRTVQFSLEWLRSQLQGQRLQLRIYGKERCPEGHEVRKGAFGPLGGLKRLTWWCPQCQSQASSRSAPGPED
ncbi:endonuclease 8-like 2 [Varanus komodoensis]|uniref:endonuclease 8-like 2 n=1 Tax=Varanus komodoensis TaxID=61221 RepID=UPI001CF78965|nr:endonuclease 8-like 2 [Varanus komodoensis]